VNAACGRALLCGLPDPEIKRIVLRSNASGVAVSPVNHQEFLDSVEMFRRTGYCVAPTIIEGVNQLVVNLPNPGASEPLALVLAVPEQETSAGLGALLEFVQSTIWEVMRVRVEIAAPCDDVERLVA
jgi:DNA-binding IclR family transcriptional regulator